MIGRTLQHWRAAPWARAKLHVDQDMATPQPALIPEKLGGCGELPLAVVRGRSITAGGAGIRRLRSNPDRMTRVAEGRVEHNRPSLRIAAKVPLEYRYRARRHGHPLLAGAR